MANFFEEVFIRQKLKNPLGLLLAFGLAGVIGFLLATKMVLGLLVIGGLIGICILITCITYPEVSLYGLIAFIFNNVFFVRLLNLDFPGGVVYDILLFTGCIGILLSRRHTGRSDGYFFKSQVALWFTIMVGYNIIEVANPTTHNMTAWINGARKSLEELVLLFMAYNIFTSMRMIKRFLTVLLILSVIAGAYAVFQQIHGLMDFERAWVEADQNRFGLLFIQGNFRKFSTFPGPTSFGVDMSACALLFALIAMYQKGARRFWMFLGAFILLWGMVYSGTRTANVIIVAGLALYIMLGFDRKPVRVFTLCAALAFVFALYVPIYSSQPLNRFRSSFIGTKDESYQLREMDRRFIQHYIYSHPIGWGLGTTNGAPGEYSMGTPLDGFQTDDQYLRIALETGWIGLILFCCTNFVILRMGIRGYFRSRNPTRKVIYAACLAALLAFMVTELAQEAIGQLECDVIIVPLVAIMMRLDQMDKSEAASPQSEPAEAVPA